MARKTIYCAQAFAVRAGRFIGGELFQFSTEERARRGAEALMTGNLGVAVFSMTGHPDEDVWEEPRLIETFGVVPAVDDVGRAA